MLLKQGTGNREQGTGCTPVVSGANGRAAPVRPGPRYDPRSRGVIIVIMLLAMILLASLVFYVFNLGVSVDKRVAVQGAADASAHAAATHTARSMNLVANGNMEMARLISMVNVMDSVPLAIDFTYTEDQEVHLDDEAAIWLAVDHMIKHPSGLDPMLKRELIKTRDEIGRPTGNQDDTDDKTFGELNELFKNEPELITNLTHFRPPDSNQAEGDIWTALYALDEHNQAAMETQGVLAAVAAVRVGEGNVDRADDRVTAAPAVPLVPWERGDFYDFEKPVLEGLLPNDVDDKVTNRGPWDTVLGFRSSWDGGRRQGRDHRGDPPGWVPPRGPGGSGGYRTYGWQEWMLRRRHHDRDRSYDRMWWHLNRISRIKASYVFPKKRNDSDPRSLQRLVDPDWEIDVERDDERSRFSGLKGFVNGDQDDLRRYLDNANQEREYTPVPETVFEFGENWPKQVHQTLYLVLDVYHATENDPFLESRQYKNGDPDGSTTWFIRHNRWRPRFYRRWQGPEDSPPGGQMQKRFPRGNANLPDPHKTFSPDHSYRRESNSGRYLYKEQIRLQTNPFVPQGKYRAGAYPELGLIPPILGYDDSWPADLQTHQLPLLPHPLLPARRRERRPRTPDPRPLHRVRPQVGRRPLAHRPHAQPPATQ